jgi:uncharacterized protein (DUF2252 family)
VRLHGDAHVGQFAVTKDARGRDDFDDSTRGPTFVDIVRCLGSIDLAVRQRAWRRDRGTVWDRSFEGYRRGLAEPDYCPIEPDIVRDPLKQTPNTPQAHLARGERQMQPIEPERLKAVHIGMDALGRLARRDRSDLAPDYFTVIRAGWLRMGVGSAAARKVLIRVQGQSADPADDELIEAKEVANRDGVACPEDSSAAQAFTRLMEADSLAG